MNWDSELLEAARNGDLIKVKTALEKGANPNAKDKDGDTPLHFAAQEGHVKIAKLLLEHGADPNARNYHDWGRTPLHRAAIGGHVEIVKILLERGVDPRIADNEGRIPLDYAKDSTTRSLLESALEKKRITRQRRVTKQLKY